MTVNRPSPPPFQRGETREQLSYRLSTGKIIMQIGSIVRSVHIAVPHGARGIVMRILGDMAMVVWYAGEPGASLQLNTEPFFLEDLIDTGELVARPAGALTH
jgi:hypothetical protein